MIIEKFGSVFHLFQVEWKQNKILQISEIIQQFQNIFTYYDKDTWLKKMNALWLRVAAQLSLPLPGTQRDAWKQVKTSNISGAMQPIFSILFPCVWENNGILNKNYWDDLES